MYSEILNKNSYNAIYIIEAVLDNLCEDTQNEMIKLFGSNYQEPIFEKIQDSEIFVIRLHSNHEPVGLYGLIELDNESAGIFLLTTDNLHKGNIITFLKGARKQVDEWSKQYKLIMDNCDKKNKTIQKWLKLLGFKPSDIQNKDFQIYYKGDITRYKDIENEHN